VTDHAVYGGHHSVIFPGRLGLETWAFLQACHGAGLEVTIDGWLRSGEKPVVVADRVLFHVGEAVRQEAARQVNQLLKDQL
jgi:hypothetical protein